ncbi:MAG: hypothetical protein JXB13_05930 [Phycisphaerae bacterium]|nr:hypothetical protein [Phycisphaerae bacterium]
MAAGYRQAKFRIATAILLAGFVCAGQATAQLLEEDFDAVTGTGGGIFWDGLGFGTFFDWDDGIEGESAAGEATGFARVQISAQGLPAGGVDGTGGGELAFTFASFNMVDEDFNGVTGFGGGAFLVGDGVTPNRTGSTSSWDSGIEGEHAFCVTRGGAILNGQASAQGLTTGGVGGTGAGQIDVTDVILNGGSWYAGLSWPIAGFPGGSGVLINPGFELGGWDVIYGWDVWADTSGSYPSVLIGSSAGAHEGSQYLKVWGRAPGMDSSGVAQTLRAEPGQTWELDCWTKHITGDSISGTDKYAVMRIEFYDGLNAEPIASESAVILDGTSPLDVWIDNTPVLATAPAGTVSVRASLRLVKPSDQGGAALFDTVSFEVVSGPPAFDLSDYSLTADIKGDADTGSGEVYGHYQLRVEDKNGNRLVFESQAPADGNWVTLGGTLDQAIEKNWLDVPSNGVFDLNSETLTVMVLFDPNRSPAWGTGGTLTVDNLTLTNDRPDGSSFGGSLLWLNLPETSVIDPRFLTLTADVKGNTVGGHYALSLQGFTAIPNVDEDFADITADSTLQLAGPGDASGSAVDWHSAIKYNEVFFGTVNASVTNSGGVWARALTAGGYGDDGGCMQIEVLDVWPKPTGYWYAGTAWRNQALGSTDLSQVTLTANVKGTWNPSWLQSPAQYVLRVEDPEGDWIGFQQTYDGTYQSVGGLLSTTNASGASGHGNGVFDIDTNLDYRVAIIFIGLGTPGDGNWGGVLTIDDVYLSASPTPKLEEAGRVTFAEAADGTFQSVGGLLADGSSTWAPRGGQFYPEWGYHSYNWDAGIEGETAFAGYGWGAFIATASAEGCTDCGVGGSGGGVFTGKGLDAPPGYYWVGVAWPFVEIDMSNLSQVSFTVDVKGIWDPGAGETPGAITIRLEDEGGKRISRDSSAVDGNYHTLGGTLNTFTAESGFSTTSPTYTVTIIVWGSRSPDWGTGTTVYFDNLSITDPTGTVISENFDTVVGPTPGLLSGLDACAVTLTMQDAVHTWGSNGSLTIDNLRYTPIPRSCDADGDLDLAEFAVMQACYSGEGGGVAAGCECADADGDADVDLADYVLLSEFFTGPQ